jgi:hypothetical protein
MLDLFDASAPVPRRTPPASQGARRVDPPGETDAVGASRALRCSRPSPLRHHIGTPSRDRTPDPVRGAAATSGRHQVFLFPFLTSNPAARCG